MGLCVALFDAWQESAPTQADTWPEVEVAVGRVVVDLHHTSRNLFATGIQRVARETARRWADRADVLIIGWTDGYTGYRRLGTAEIESALEGDGPAANGATSSRQRSAGAVAVHPSDRGAAG